MKELKGEEKGKEEKEYQRVAEGSKGYIEVLLDSNEVVVHLQTRLRVISRVQEQSRVRALPNLEAATFKPNVETQSTGLGQGQPEAMGLKVNLPKLQLPTFDGNIQQWQEFWDVFMQVCNS